MPKLKASEVWDFVVPVADLRPSYHGSQREDALIEGYLPGWYREISDSCYAELYPGVPQRHEGNSRGSGRIGWDGFKPRTDRSGGMDVLSLKVPGMPKNGTPSTSHEMFRGTRPTGEALIRAISRNHRNRKAQPMAVVHTDTSAGFLRILEWCIRDVGAMYAAPTNAEAWATWNGLPVKPPDDRKRGAGGSPASVWVSFLHRELLGYDAKGNPIVRYTPDANGAYMTINATFSKRSGAVFRTGTPAEFAAEVNAATVLR
jgi:hypothetical protein